MKSNVMLRRSLFLFTFAGLSLCARAEYVDFDNGPFGDWSGLHARLYEHGVSFRIGYIPEVAYNAQGGDKHLTRNAEQFTFALSFDLEKLVGMRNSTFQAVITERDGSNLSADARLGTLQEVQEIYGRGQTWRWTRFWYDGGFLNGAVDLKLGRLSAGENFMSFSCTFQNLSFCGSLPGNIVSTWYNWPVSQWGARLKLNFARQTYLEVGAYQVNPSYLQTNNGLKLNDPSGRIGTLMPVEVGWTPKWGKAELPGAYRAGVWYDDSDSPDVYLAADGAPLASSPGMQPLIRHHETGGYAMLQQQVTAVHGDLRRGLTLFANFVRASRDTARIDQLIDLGLFYTGPLSVRPQDDLGFAVGRTRVNSHAANLPGPGESTSAAGSEYPAELYYSVVATPWLTLRPNVQYIWHPGGLNTNPNVVVIGLKAIVIL